MSDDHLRLLYEISALVARFDGDPALAQVLALTARAMPVTTAVFVLDVGDALGSHAWKAEGVPPSRVDEAIVTARASYAWFAGQAARATVPSPSKRRFIAVPLAVERGNVFGALQVEAAAAVLDEGQVFFVNATANLVAMAVERRAVAERAERRLRAQLDFTRGITASLGEGVLACDTVGRITFMNPAAEKLLGRDEAGMLGTATPDTLRIQTAGGTLLEDVSCPLVRVLETEAPIASDEHSLIGRDGVPIPISYTAAPIRSGMRTLGAAIVFRDIIAVKRSERAQRLLARTSAAFGDSLDYAATLAALVRCTVPVFADQCLLDEIEETGRVAGPDATYRAEALATGHAVLVERRSDPPLAQDAEAPLSRRFDSSGARSLIVVPLFVRGRTFGMLTFGMADSGRRFTPDDVDLAEELGRRAATAIDNVRLYRALEQAVRARQDMLAVVSHDLRNPLNTVSIATASLLEQRPDFDRRKSDRRAIEMIERAGKRMERMTSDLLDVSSIEAGHLAVSSAPTTVRSLMVDVLEVMTPSAAGKGLQLVVDPLDSSLVVRCDRERILQVLTNLVGNAIKFTASGGHIQISAKQAAEFVRFSVADTGPGIAEELLPHVFERYRQAAETASKGRGLGLFITKGIVEAHGGRIVVDSVLGSGTKFSFDLPSVGGPA